MLMGANPAKCANETWCGRPPQSLLCSWVAFGWRPNRDRPPEFGALFLDFQWVAVMLRPRKPGLSMCVAGSNATETSVPNYSSGNVATRASTAAAARAVFPNRLNVLAGFSREGAAADMPPPPRQSRPPLPLPAVTLVPMTAGAVPPAGPPPRRAPPSRPTCMPYRALSRSTRG